MVCPNETILVKELKHLKHTSQKIYGYPWWVIDQVSTFIQKTSTRVKGLNITLILLNNPLRKCTL